MKIGLAMLVKDEADVIENTLERCFPVIDAWTIIDTGSRDNTKKIARRALAHLPGQLLSAKFAGFGASRTMLLAAARARKTDYTLMLDGDHTLHIDGERPTTLDADSYLVRIRGDMEWRLPLLTRTEHPFEYRGAAHAYLASDTTTHTEKTDWLSIDGGPGATREKLERDLVLLTSEFAEQPDNTRTVFYLAETHRFLGNIEQAIRLYRLRADMAGFDEERYFARYQLGCLLGEHVSFARGAGELLRAWNERPTRAEALRALANLANSVADKLDVPDDVLFVTPDAYRRAA